MKNRKALLLTLLLLLSVFIAGSVYIMNRQHGITSEDRQALLSRNGNHVVILREIHIKDSIISEIMDQQSGYGYAQFEKNDRGNYILKTRMVRTRQEDSIVTDIIEINDEMYEILMCNAGGLEYAEVSYTDDTTGEKVEPLRVDMHNQTVALLKAPEYSSYTRKVTFYNYEGDRFE
ncbi:MAG TPA: hypothetical protein DHM90_01975 [Clostridiaceae bacterium]|nr:hypothetical protein [Clostridiaceae bacterium]